MTTTTYLVGLATLTVILSAIRTWVSWRLYRLTISMGEGGDD